MFGHHRSSFLGVVGVSLAACTVRPPPPLLLSGDVQCRGGTIRNAGDAAQFTGCQVIRGNLGVTGSDVRDLGALHTLRIISGTLTIADNPLLSRLSGLEHLSSAGRIELRNNPKLDSLAALSGLVSTESLSIEEAPELRSLSGLEGLTRLEELTLDRTGIFTTRGLGNLREVRNLEVTRNRRLIDLGGLSAVTRVGNVRIEQNPRLCAQLGLLSEFTRVDGKLRVYENQGLSPTDLTAFTTRVRRPSVSEPFLSAPPPSALEK